jgi:hypothetical protein
LSVWVVLFLHQSSCVCLYFLLPFSFSFFLFHCSLTEMSTL